MDMCSLPRTPLTALVLAGFATLTGCGSEAPPAVTAGPVGFAADEVLGLPDDRLRLLGELAVFGAAVADSALESLGRPWIDARTADLRWRRVQAQAALDSAGVGDDVLEARYHTAPELELTVRHLLVFSARYETDATRAAAREKAEAALRRIRAGEPFPLVAAEVSEEPGAESREGLLTPGREGAWVPEFWAAAAALAPGEISPVVETQYGFHVLRLEGRDTVAFSEARPRVALEVAELMGLRAGDVEPPPLPDDLPPPPDAGTLFDPTVGDDTPVAQGPGWAVALGDVRDAAALLPYDRWRRLATDPAVARSAFEAAVRRAVGTARAEAGGTAADEADRAVYVREFRDRAEQWGLQLGFAPGLGLEGVRRGALAALSTTGQNAALARDGLRSQWGGLLHRWREIRVGETPPGPGA